MTTPRYSIVIPLYNKERYIGRALESVLKQSVTDIEAIVVDDGSTDDGTHVVQGYDDARVRLIRQPNGGVSAARNRGIAEASGQIVAFLDADDSWMPDFLETIDRLYRNYPDCGAFATNYEIITPDKHRFSPRNRHIPEVPWEGILPDYFRLTLDWPVFNSSSVAVRSDVFKIVGKFPVGEPFGEDLDTWCRIALHYRIAYSTTIGAFYFQDADNRADTGKWVNHDFQLFRTLDKAVADSDLPDWVNRDYLIEYKNKKLLELASSCIGASDGKSARDHLRTASATKLLRRQWFYLFIRSYVPKAIVRLMKYAKWHG
jgi:glycosyltransferase involved in cell wall biosynthesis